MFLVLRISFATQSRTEPGVYVSRPDSWYCEKSIGVILVVTQYPSLLSIAVIKRRDQKQLRRKEFIWLTHPRSWFLTREVGKGAEDRN